MIKKILVGVCRSPAQAALTPIVVDIASRNQAQITAVALLDSDRLVPVRPPATGVYSSKLDEQKKTLARALEQMVSPLRTLRQSAEEDGVAFQERQVEKSLESSISAVWQFNDLIVLSSAPWYAGEKGPRDATQVLHFLVKGIRPILAISPYAPAHPRMAMVALSGSLESAKAMKHFAQLMPWSNLPVHLVTIGSPKNGEQPDRLLSEAAGYVTAHNLKATTSVLEDSKDRTEVLLREAKAVGADALVLGSSYRRFLSVERFGANARNLLARFEGAIFLSH